MTEPRRRQPRVLVVEDDDRLVMAMCDVLKDAGFEAIAARDGHVAIQKLTNGSALDVIILDVEMPIMDGCEFIEWMRQNGIDIPVVLATLADECNAHDLGAVVKITKPFVAEQLLDGVAIALRPRSFRD